MTPAAWASVFAAYRQNRNALSSTEAEAFAGAFTDADWKWIEDERGRWQSVSDRSSIARDSLKIAQAICPFRPVAPALPSDPVPDPSATVHALVDKARAAEELSGAVAPLGSAVRLIDGRVKALEDR